LIDVGGHQSQQVKWHNFWEEGLKIDLIIFVVALDECFIKKEEYDNLNGLQVTLQLWSKVTSQEKLQCIPFVLFLNKVDKFEKNLKHPLYNTNLLPDKARDKDYCIQNIIQQFRDNFGGCCMSEYVTCALNTTEIYEAFASIYKIY